MAVTGGVAPDRAVHGMPGGQWLRERERERERERGARHDGWDGGREGFCIDDV